MKKLLVVIDLQNDFIDGCLGTKEAVAIVEHVEMKIRAYEESGQPVIFTRDTHYEDYLKTREGRALPVPHCIMGTQGWEICTELFSEEAAVIDKSTFGSLELAEMVVLLAPAEIELVGLCTDICVISNALILKARLPEAAIIVDAACCAGVTPQSHETALNAMKMCQIQVVNEAVLK